MNEIVISVSCARRVYAKSLWPAKASSDQGSRQGTNEKASQMKGQRWQQQDKPPSQWVQHSPTEVEIHSRGAFRLCEVLMGGVKSEVLIGGVQIPTRVDGARCAH